MSTLTSYASQSARDSAAPAASNTGLCIFRSDTNAIEVSDGSNYLSYNNDGIAVASTFLTLNGTNQYVDIPDDTAIGFSGDISISAWFYLDNVSGFKSIVGKRDGGGTNYVFYVNGSNLVSYDGGSLRTDTTTLSANQWYHGVLVIDSGTSTTFYLNNSLSSTQAASTITNNDANLQIGNDGVGSYFDGYIDDVAIYNRTLSSSEIGDLYGGTFPSSGLVGKWTMEGDSGTTITDSSGSGNNGTASTSGMLITGARTF
jgi:hypothetical protein